MQSVLDEMHLPEAVGEALLHGSGPYAPFLKLAQLSESFDDAALRAQAAELQLAPEQVNRAMIAALAFADSFQD